MTLSAPVFGGMELWTATLSGTDLTTGFAWPTHLWGARIEFFFMLCQSPPPNIDDCMSNRIEEVPGPFGAPTRALYMERLSGRNVTQNMYYLSTFPNGERSDLYTRWWMKLGREVERTDAGGMWRMAWEYKAGPDFDYRQKIEIRNTGSGPYWYPTADTSAYLVNGRCENRKPDGGLLAFTELWNQENRAVPVPVEEWFLLEVFSHRSTRDGRFWAAVNGQVIADYRGQTVGACGGQIDRLMLPPLYTNVMPAHQWIDDYELWDGFPCASPPCGPASRDGGSHDAGAPDSGAPDAGPRDGGSPDASSMEQVDGGGLRFVAPRLSAHQSLPTIDGDPREFEHAPPLELRLPTGQTAGRYWLSWDDEALYVAARVRDGLLNATGTTRDGPLWDDDSLELMFDTHNDRGANELPGSDDYKFFLNILNIQSDERGGGVWNAWNSEWQSAVKVVGTSNNDTDMDEGYALELRIPWASWGVTPPRVGTKWGFDLLLNDARSGAARRFSAWSNSTGGTSNDPDGWGTLEFGDGAPGASDAGNDDSPPRVCGCQELNATGGIAQAVILLAIWSSMRRRNTRRGAPSTVEPLCGTRT